MEKQKDQFDGPFGGGLLQYEETIEYPVLLTDAERRAKKMELADATIAIEEAEIRLRTAKSRYKEESVPAKERKMQLLEELERNVKVVKARAIVVRNFEEKRIDYLSPEDDSIVLYSREMTELEIREPTL